MNSTITMPRSVVEQALAAFEHLVRRHYWLGTDYDDRAKSLRAALEQPQDHTEQNLNMVPAGWKLVPVKPTEDMLNAVAWPGCAATDWEHMLAAAPQPPTAEKSSGVEQPQGEQEPVAWQRRMRTKWMRDGEWWPWQECSKEVAYDYKQAPVIDDWEYESRPLYTRPQPRRQPLTDEQIVAMWQESIVGLGRAIERAHGIGGEK